MPIRMLLGWLLPAWPANSFSISQRAAWKPRMQIWACSGGFYTQCPSAGNSHGVPVGAACNRHQTANALGDLIEAQLLALGGRPGGSLNAAINQRGLIPRRFYLGFDVGAEVLDDNVGFAWERLARRAGRPFTRLQKKIAGIRGQITQVWHRGSYNSLGDSGRCGCNEPLPCKGCQSIIV